MSYSKSNIHQAFWLGISSISSIFVSLVSAAILSRFFDKVEYGTYKQIMFVYSTLLVIFEAGLPSVFSYFLPRYSLAEGKYIVKRINQILFFSGGLLSITLFFSAEPIAQFLNNPELAKGLKLFSPFPFFTLPTLGLEGIYIVNKNTKYVAIYNTITRILMLVCIVLPVLLYRNSYEVAIIGWGFAAVIAFFIALYLKNRPYCSVNETIKVPRIMKKVLSYSLPILGSSCILLFYNSINQVLISRNFGTEAFAEFANGFLPLPFISIIVTPVRKMLIPLFSKSKNENCLDESVMFFNKAIYEMGLIIIPLCIFCFSFSKEIMLLLYGEQYTTSYIFFQINLIFNLCEIIPLQVILVGVGKTKILFVFDVVCTLLLLFMNALLCYFNVSSPVMIALVFVMMQVFLRNICPYIYLRYKERVIVISKAAIVGLLKIVLHVFVVIIFVFWCSRFYNDIATTFLRLTISGILFYVLLVGSGIILRINYLNSLKQLIQR